MADIKWIKITTDMFDDEKIKLIEKMPEADTLLVIWVKLICQAGRVNDRGYIYITPDLPFNAEDLAAVLGREIKTVRLALETFRRLQMVTIDDNGVMYLNNFEKHQNIDGMEKVRQKTLQRVHNFRDRKLIEAGNVTVTLRNATEKIREDKSREEKDESLQNVKVLINEKRYDEILIGHQTLSTIIRCLNGEYSCSKTNLRLYLEELKKLDINLDEIGVTLQTVTTKINLPS
ncbi:phage replisome organizer N-terminal domain-containing protein [Candidatus Pacearchaeota archaeon]|jgi:predicted phage replisome organizer|nr:phage replisome organizer N-terminal domain-containing protein [Candidatus Pacearchaeota archaeon]